MVKKLNKSYETIDGVLFKKEIDALFHDTLLLIDNIIEDELGISIQLGTLERWEISELIKDKKDDIKKYVKKHKQIIIKTIENL